MTSIESTPGVSGVEPLNLKISTDTTSCAPSSSDSASSPTSSTKSCGENIVPTASSTGTSQDQASTTANLTLVSNTASPIPDTNATTTTTLTTTAPLANKNNLLNNEANVKSNMQLAQTIVMNSNLIKPNNAQIVNNGSPTKVPIPRIKKPAPLKPAQHAPTNSMPHPKPILPAPHNPSPVKTVHIPIAAKPPAQSNNKSVTAPLLNILPSQAKTSPKSTAANGKSDDTKNMQSLPSINTFTNGATFNLNQNQFYQFVPVSSQHLAALAAANGGNGAGNPLIIATTSMPKPYMAQNRTNEANTNATESSTTPATGQLIMKTIMPNGSAGLDPLLQQQYLNLLQQKQQLKLSPNGIRAASSASSDPTANTSNSAVTHKPALAVLPKPANTAPSQQSSAPNDDYLALQQRLLAEERRNNLLENKLREQEMLQQKQMQHIQPNATTTPNVPKAKLKPIAVKPASSDSKIETTPVANKSELSSEQGGNLVGDESLTSTTTPVPTPKSASNPSGKKRGRPRLYDVDPQTGKSIKPKPNTNVGGSMHSIQPNLNPQLVKIAINPSNVLLMGAMPGMMPQNPLVNSAPTAASPGMFPSPSTSNTNSSDLPTENTAPSAPQAQPSTDVCKSDSEKENNNDECKRAESRSPNKRKKSSPVKVVEEEVVVSPPKKPSTPPPKSATGIPKQITPADLSPSAPLTHFLDGYIVKEAGKPFPLTKNQSDSSNKKHKSDENIKCDQCGAKINKKSAISSGEDKSVLFCSESCVKRYHKKSKHRSDSSEMSKRFKHDQDMNDVTRTPPRQKLNSSMSIDSPSSKRSPHCKHYGSSSKHKHHSSSHKKDHHRSRGGGHHNSHNTSMTNGNNNDETAMDSSFVQPAPVLASSNLSQAPIRTSSPNTSLVDSSYPSGDPTNWSCDQVYQFVCQVTGNEQVARLFKTEEVDGSALSLIRDDHLVQTMQVKLGPALKIMSKFNELKAKHGH